MAIGLGGTSEEVRKLMGCSEDGFRRYLVGREQPPAAELARLLEFLSREQSKLVRRNEALLAKVRALSGRVRGSY